MEWKPTGKMNLENLCVCVCGEEEEVRLNPY